MSIAAGEDGEIRSHVKEAIWLYDASFVSMRDGGVSSPWDKEVKKPPPAVKVALDVLQPLWHRSVNKAACGILGYEEEEIIDLPFSEVLAGEDVDTYIFDKLAKEHSAANLEVTCRTKTDNYIPMLFSGSLIKDKEGNLDGVVGMARDITERKQAEERERLRTLTKVVLHGKITARLFLVATTTGHAAHRLCPDIVCVCYRQIRLTVLVATTTGKTPLA